MAKKSGIYRLTISITQDLKRRMDKVADQVNWSATAAAAFETKLAEMAAEKERPQMSNVIERLRSSEDEDLTEGFATGKEWAEQTASKGQLKRLARFRASLEGQQHGWNDWFTTTAGNAFSPGELLAQEIDGKEKVTDRFDMNRFWSDILDDTEKIDDDSFAKGFAEGALAVWDEVKSKL